MTNTDEQHTVLPNQPLRVAHWSVLIYVKRHSIDSLNDDITRNLICQSRMRCGQHKTFLLKQPLSCNVSCCVKDCDRTSRWRCAGKGRPCFSAVCLAHGKELIGSDNIVDVSFEMVGKRLPVTRISTMESDGNKLPDESIGSNDDESDNEIWAPIGIDDFAGYDDDAPAHSRRDVIPIYNTSETDTVASHYLWNTKYNVMRRADRNQNIRTNSILQHIVASSRCASVSLLYPEAQLFPRIFWCEDLGTVLGAMPSFMLNTSGKSLFGIASIDEHIRIRLCDGDILTSRESPYWHYIFDLKVNAALNVATSNLVFQRGFEFLSEKSTYQVVGAPTPGAQLPMSDDDATRRIQELCCLLKKGSWDYFLTMTVNDTETPGVREITKAISWMADGDDDERQRLTDCFLPFILRAWERFVSVFFKELVMRNSTVIGPVKNVFYRFEFQSSGSPGNKCHVHAGITLHDEPKHVTSARICCCSAMFHSPLFGTDYETLFEQGIVKDIDEYERWKNIVACVQHHDCNKANFRCQKATDADGNKICRYHRQPQGSVYDDMRGWFEELSMPYSEEVYTLLAEMQLAEKKYDPVLGEDRWYVDQCLRAGKWHYFSRSDEFFLSSIPILSAICRSATNVDMCDRKFQVGIEISEFS